MIAQLQIDIFYTALTLWRECRGELEAVKVGVACVIRNRVNAHWRNKHNYQDIVIDPWQFSGMTVPGDVNLHKWPTSRDGAWEVCLLVAENVVTDRIEDVTAGSVFYHDVSLPGPPEAWGAVHEVARLGRIIFYRQG